MNRLVGKTECNSTSEIPSTYFPITLADLDSNGIENILIVRLHGQTNGARVRQGSRGLHFVKFISPSERIVNASNRRSCASVA